jgi:F420-0:gamma-glutamyl ligase-like protein
MFSIEELSVIRQGLDLVNITGASARKMVELQNKVEQALEKEIQKREKERQSIEGK